MICFLRKGIVMLVVLKDYFSSSRVTIDLDLDKTGVCKGQSSQNLTMGLYSQLGTYRVGLFVIGSKLFLCMNDVIVDTSIDEISTSYSKNEEWRELQIRVGIKNHLIAYANPRAPVSTPFYSEDEEDVDFGLWIHNIFSSGERRQIIINRWANGIDMHPENGASIE